MESTCINAQDNILLANARKVTAESAALLTIVRSGGMDSGCRHLTCNCDVCTCHYMKACARYQENILCHRRATRPKL